MIDDEDVVREVVTRMLDRLGYDVTAKSDGSDGIAYFTDHKDEIDLVLVDVAMPEMSGLECLDRLRSIDPDVRVVFATGFEPEGEVAVARSGVSGFIQKPFHLSELSRVVQDALSREDMNAY